MTLHISSLLLNNDVKKYCLLQSIRQTKPSYYKMQCTFNSYPFHFFENVDAMFFLAGGDQKYPAQSQKKSFEHHRLVLQIEINERLNHV
jgi:hypothetical protein